MRRLNLLIIFLVIIYMGISSGVKILKAVHVDKERAFFVEERITLKSLPKDKSNMRVWIPYPVSDNWQTISDFKLESPFDADLVTEKEYGNKIIYLTSEQDFSDENTLEVLLRFKVNRKEYDTSLGPEVSYNDVSHFLKPNRLVPVNEEIKALATKITYEKDSDLEKVRAIYDFIIDELTYSKDDPSVCGIGDSLLTMEVKKGICTDYHSLFISLVRSLEIPAKFEIGFPIPAGVEQHTRKGYHCWAKFYLEDKGWIPVDISEADKHPEKRDYFFGHIDENRVHFATGRDVKLKYAKNKEPLNFFIYPYVELNDSQFYNIDFEISFREL